MGGAEAGSRAARIVLTGAPCADKSTLAAAMKGRGFGVVEDTARRVVAAALRGDCLTPHVRDTPITRDLADLVLSQQVAAESEMRPETSYALDRFVGDCAVFRGYHRFDSGPWEALNLRSRYDVVLLLESLPFIEDEVRDRSDIGAREVLVDRLRSALVGPGYLVLDVPVAPIPARLSFIVAAIEATHSSHTAR